MPQSILVVTYPKLRTVNRLIAELVNLQIPATQLGVIFTETSNQQPDSEPVSSLRLVQLLPHYSQTLVPGIGATLSAGVLVLKPGQPNLIHDLMARGLPEQEAHYYAESLRRGDVLVAVVVEDEAERVAEMVALLCRYHPLNLSERVWAWRERGWRTFDPMADPFTAEELQRKRSQYPRLSIVSQEDCGEKIVQRYRYVERSQDEPEPVPVQRNSQASPPPPNMDPDRGQ